MRLIDSDALKKALDEQMINFEENCRDSVFDIIDNAPTIFNCNACKNMGNERECVDCHDYSNYVHYEEKPKGEWEESHICSCGKILRMRMDVIEHKCKHCGRWSIKWVGTIPDNFCSYCGAKMGGKEE